MKLIKSKKAIGVDDLFPLLFVIIAFIFIILLFTYSHSKEVKEINEDVTQITKEIESYELLNKFLSTEVSIDLNAGNTNLPIDIIRMNMAELIILSYYNPIYKNTLIRESELILESFPKPSKDTIWNIAIYLMPEDHFIETIRKIRSSDQYPIKIGHINIPLTSKTGEYLQIKMYEVHKVKRTIRAGNKF